MRKNVVGSAAEQARFRQAAPTPREDWLDLETLASVEVSSEDPESPIENALVPGAGAGGWRASGPGPQTILILFDPAQPVRRISLSFVERAYERQQEFTLRWTADGGQAGEIVRQQWTFSPGGSTEEEETYSVNLAQLRTLTVAIDPDRGRNRYPATLAALRLG